MYVPSSNHTASTLENQANMGMSTAKAARYDTDFTFCIVCQEQTEELLVQKRTAHYTTMFCNSQERGRGMVMDNILEAADVLEN